MPYLKAYKTRLPEFVALKSFNEMFLSTAFGQSLDVQAAADEFAYWKVAQTKSSPFFGAALQMGALAGGGTARNCRAIEEVRMFIWGNDPNP